MPMLDILGLLESLISSAPEAVALYQKIAPHISPKADIPDTAVSEITALAPAAVAAVETSRAAIASLVQTHTAASPAA